MKDLNNTEDYPIPEGLEFKESYMQDAFALYDAEKQKRRRRLLIWWIASSAGFAAIVLTGVYLYFSTKNPAADTDKKPQFVENKISVRTRANTKTSPEITTNNSTNRSQFLKRNAIKTSFVTDKNMVKSTAQGNPDYDSTVAGPHEKDQTKRGSTESAGIKKNDDPESTPDNSTDDAVPVELADKPARDSSVRIDLTVLPLKPAKSAYTKDTTSHLIQAQNQTHETDSNFRKHQVYINLGVNTLFGMKELQNRVTFRECIGVSYNYQINPKWSVGAGLEYHSISRISYKRKVGDTTNSDQTTTILNKTTLNYISFLPQVSYQLGTKHQLTAGFGIEYLLIDPGESYQIQNYTSESNSRSNNKLYYSTFNRFNFSASIGYSYRFGRFMSVHALYHFGFTDITKNNSFNDTFDRNSRLQLMLKIKLY